MANDVVSTSSTQPIASPDGTPGAKLDVNPLVDDVATAIFEPDRDVAVAPADATAPRSRWGLLREHDFRQLFLADTGSQFGTQIGWLALPLTAAVTLHATVFQMGVVTAADSLPYLLISLPAGAIADRSRRRYIMIMCDLLRALTLASVPIAWWLGILTIWQVIVVAFVIGVFSATFDVAYQSLLPHLVDSDKVTEGNAKLQGIAAVSQIGGPTVAGFVIRALTAPVAVGVNTVTFLSSAFFLGRIRRREERPERRSDQHLGRDILEGVRFVQRNVLLRALAAEAGVSNFFNSMTNAVLLYLLAHTLQVSAGTIGALLSIASLGGLAGALLATKVARWVGEGRVLWLSLAVGSPFLIGVPLMQNNYTLWLAAASFTFAVATSVIFNVTAVSFRQRLAPPYLLGRVNATMRFVVWGIMPLGGLVGGLFGTWFGVRETLWIAAIGSMLAFLPAFFSPLRNMRTLPSNAPS